MMTAKAGEFWVAEIIFTDGTTSKRRPILILWTDGDDVIVAAVTSSPEGVTIIPERYTGRSFSASSFLQQLQALSDAEERKMAMAELYCLWLQANLGMYFPHTPHPTPHTQPTLQLLLSPRQLHHNQELKRMLC